MGSLIIEDLPAQPSGTYTFMAVPHPPTDFPDTDYGIAYLSYEVNGQTFEAQTTITFDDSETNGVVFEVIADQDAGITTITWDIDAEKVTNLRFSSQGIMGSLIIEDLPAQPSGTYTFMAVPHPPTDFPDTDYGIAYLSYEVNGQTFDVQTTIEFSNVEAPYFSTFNNTSGAVTALPARINVSWSLENRPDNTNLEFVQVMPSGAVVNIELPRHDPLVPSSGNGVVDVQNPAGDDAAHIRVQLVDLTTGAVLTARSTYVTSTSPTVPTLTPSSPQAVTIQSFSVSAVPNGGHAQWVVTGNYATISIEWTGTNGTYHNISVEAPFKEVNMSAADNYYGIAPGVVMTLKVYDTNQNIIASTQTTTQ
jgi:hypothetical protein